MTGARVAFLSLGLAMLGGCIRLDAAKSCHSTAEMEWPQMSRRSLGAAYVLRPAEGGGYAVLAVERTVVFRPALDGAGGDGLAEYLYVVRSPPSGLGRLDCAAVCGLLSRRRFDSIQSAIDATRNGTTCCDLQGVHWLIPVAETRILQDASRYTLTDDEGRLIEPWYVVRKTCSWDIELVRCDTAADVLNAVTPAVPAQGISDLPSSVRTLSRYGSRGAPAGSHVLRVDSAGAIHVLRIEATLFRETCLEAHDRDKLLSSPESVDLVVVGTTFAQSFVDIGQAISAIEDGRLVAEPDIAVWPVPAEPTRGLLIYDSPRTKGREHGPK